MKYLDSLLCVAEGSLLAVPFVMLSALCFLQVPRSEEARRVLFIWATFIGCSLAVERGAHLAATAGDLRG